jgi:CBS domain-containing protein
VGEKAARHGLIARGLMVTPFAMTALLRDASVDNRLCSSKLALARRPTRHRHGRRREGETMKTVQQLLEAKRYSVVSVSPDDTVLEALKVMAEKEIGAVIVIQNGHLVGIFSERDYARKVVLQGKASKDTPVREIMTEKVVCVSPDQTIEDCMGLMTDKRIRHLPVLEHKKVIGVVSIGDVVKEMLYEKEFVIQQLESYIHN